MFDAVYLSPHLDDAVLSCGGRIAHETARGQRILVVTAFTADEPAEPPSQLAADLRRWWRLPPGEVMARRRAEDDHALAALGAETLRLDLPEAPYRSGKSGVPHYSRLRDLFGPLATADAAATLPSVEARLRALPPSRSLVAPLGVGGHVDHQLVRRAAVAVGGAELRYYEEFPYVEWKWWALRRALAGGSMEPEVLPLDGALFERKVQAILAYESQVPAMFRSEARLRKQLRRHLRRAGGERLWRPA